MGYIVRVPNSEKEWEAYFDLRYRVLRKPLGQERGSEKDQGDTSAQHFALFENGNILAIGRLDRVDSSTCQVRFVAVETKEQGRGLGKILMEVIEKNAQQEGYSKMILHARDYAVQFYKGLDYKIVAPSHKLFGVLQHFLMEKEF